MNSHGKTLYNRNLELELLGLFPSKALVSTKVAELGRLVVQGLDQVKLLGDGTGPHVEVGLDDLHQLLGSLAGGAVRLDKDGAGLGYTNSVTELNQDSASEFGVNEGLGDPSGQVGRRSIDLAEILSGEGTTTVGTPATVGIDNDLSASDAGITLRTTDNKLTRRLKL